LPRTFDIFDFAPTSEEVQAINALDTGERGGPDPEQVNPQTFSIIIQD
jgi:diketogulonate reductase-like aldo/keto reductase